MTSDPPFLPTRQLGGFRISETRAAELIELLLDRVDQGLRTELYFANSNFVVKCRAFADALATPESLIVNDGIAIDVMSLLLFRRPFAENLNGTDFTPRLLAEVRHPTRVFLLGSTESTVSRAAGVLDAIDRIEIVGTVDGYAGVRDDAHLLQKLRDTRPDILLVALGNPLQEQWIVEHRGKHGVVLVMAVGALLDFLSGNMSRAPAVLQRLKLEWLYRLVHEPRRLMRRYTVDMLKFFVHCAMTRSADTAARRKHT